ncbi:MAG: hypothetical protein E6600_12280, partial [Anaerocolumna aminovalerica]|nr:hypothetical protein [Anaerocolumna aminovalerica]
MTIMKQNDKKRNPQIPLMNEGLGELMCRRHFFIDKPYYDAFINIYLKMHTDFVINTDTLLFYRIRRKLEDIWEFIEQLLYDNQEDQERNETIRYLKSELKDLAFGRII